MTHCRPPSFILVIEKSPSSSKKSKKGMDTKIQNREEASLSVCLTDFA